MDPLSITASVMSVTTGCIKIAKTISDLREKYKHAQTTLAALCAESTVICASLSQIQSLILGRPEVVRTQLRERPELVATFDVAVTGCMVVFAVLDDEIQQLVAHGVKAGEEVGWADKAKILWKENFMKDLLQQIRGQQSALTLLMQAMQMESISDLHELIETHGLMLERIAGKTRTLRSKHASLAVSASILERTDTESVIETWHSRATETSFTFDDLIVNSQVYRRVLANASTSNLTGNPLLLPQDAPADDKDTWKSGIAIAHAALSKIPGCQELIREAFRDQEFKDEVNAVSQWYGVLNESERIVLLYELLERYPEMRVRARDVTKPYITEEDPKASQRPSLTNDPGGWI